MKIQILFLPVFICLLLFSCQVNNSQEISMGDSFKDIPSPCQEGGEPNLFVSESGQVYLSWVEYLNDTTDALVFSKLENQQWSAPKTISTGSNWFVNWADFPSLVASKDGKTLAAHWLQTSAAGTYDYDVRISQSLDEGITWTPSFIPHRDSIAAEHGFVSMLPLSDKKIFATWLDGRNTKGKGHDDMEKETQGHGHHGAMTLRTAVFDQEGNLTEEAELDSRICDCCQTSATITDDGVIVAYRDRSEEEIRDISIVRKVNGKWTVPKTVCNDNWLIAGCPVNGPAIDAYGEKVAIAWYTGSGEKPQVKVAFSNNSGADFGVPIKVNEGQPLGRVDIVMVSKETALVSWLEVQSDIDAAIKIVLVNSKGKIGESRVVAESKAARQSGFPRMVKNNNQIIFAWTHVDSLTKVKTAVLNLK